MTLNIYPDIIHEADLTPDAVGSEIDDVCNEIHEACKGFGTDEKKLVKALASQSAENRVKIALRYPEIHGKELKKVMKGECGGDLGQALQFLAVPLDVAECDMIHKACKGIGTNEKVLYPILCGRSNDEIALLKKKYFTLYDKDLGLLISSEVGGDLGKLIFSCIQGLEEDYDDEFHTEEKAKEDANAIFKAGQGVMGTDENVIFKILCASPPKYLQQVNLQYADLHGYTLFKALEKELRGDAEVAALYMLGMKLKPYETVAKLIKSACAGIGTNELLLTTTLIRYQGILKQVMEAHQELFDKSVQDRIKSELRGKYEMLLLEVCEAAE